MPEQVTRSIDATVRAVRSRSARVAEIVGRAVEAAERSQADLNSFTLIDSEGALERARALDAEVEAGRTSGALLGVPIGLKDLIDQAGRPNTLGAAFEPLRPTASATVVQRLEAAGAVVIGRTGLHEFAYGFTSENEHFGPVRNPWDTSLSPGGSSGGSGAAVAAGIVPMAVGTDTGGSVRVPAALCGVFGLKVTHGAVPLDGVFPLASSLDTVGPLARSVDDLAISFLVMAGAAEPPPEVPTDELRIATVAQWQEGPTTPDVAGALASFLDRAHEAGATITVVDEPWLEIPRDLLAAASPEIAEVHGERWRTAPHRYGHDVATRLEAAFATPPQVVTSSAAWTKRARTRLAALFHDHDVVATPTVGATRKTIGEDAIEIGGVPYPHRAVLARWTAPVNRLGLPAIAAPIAGSGTPPASVQLVGADHGDGALLGVARTLEDIGLVGVEHPPNWFD